MAVSRNSLSSELISRLEAFLAAQVRPDERICVGLSGGCDSVTLLHLLSCSAWVSQISAIHVHHGLSANADAWAAFCQQCCERWSVPFTLRKIEVVDEGQGLEAAARDARYAAFADCGADVFLLAHHRDDQAETVLFNLLRGSGVAGAAGIPAVRVKSGLKFLRPLLDVSRQSIETYARDNGLQWIDDESNADTVHARNFLRHEVFPTLVQRFPAAHACLAGAARHFAEADALLAELAVEDWQRCSVNDSLPIASLASLSRARIKNLLRYRLRSLGWRAPAALRLEEFVRQLLEAAAGKRPSLSLPDGEMRVRRGRLYWVNRTPLTEHPVVIESRNSVSDSKTS